MRTASGAKRRWFSVAGLATVALVTLSGCFPLVYLAEQRQGQSSETSADTGQNEDSEFSFPPGARVVEAGGQITGRVEQGSDDKVYFQVSQRSAIALAAFSPTGDLRMHLTGEGVDVEIDDATPIRAFSFSDDLSSIDPTVAIVLEAGVYEVVLSEYSGRSADYVVELVTGTASIARGETLGVSWEANAPALVIIDLESGNEVIETSNSSGDPRIWVAISGTTVRNDNDDANGIESRIDFSEEPFLGGYNDSEAIVVVRSYMLSQSGTTRLSLQ